MIKEIVFATNNPHKLKEIRDIVGDKFQILSLEDIGCKEEIPETADTLRDNALIKARYIKDKYGYNCFADDTGLEIDALDGAPGVYSARYAGESCDSEKNINKVLTLMGKSKQRSAKFVTYIALVQDGGVKFFSGEIKGQILEQRQGEDGFGYDPIFMPEGFEKSFAEMTHEEKNKISHRAVATNKLIDYLKSIS